MADRSELNDEIVTAYNLVARALDRFLLPRLIELGLTMSQFKALIAVSNAGAAGISVSELGKELSIGQPSASLIVDQLVRRDYARRVQDTGDRRRVLVTTTPLGLEITGDLRHGRKANFVDWLDHVSDEEAAALRIGLGALSRAAQATSIGRTPVN